MLIESFSITRGTGIIPSYQVITKVEIVDGKKRVTRRIYRNPGQIDFPALLQTLGKRDEQLRQQYQIEFYSKPIPDRDYVNIWEAPAPSQLSTLGVMNLGLHTLALQDTRLNEEARNRVLRSFDINFGHLRLK